MIAPTLLCFLLLALGPLSLGVPVAGTAIQDPPTDHGHSHGDDFQSMFEHRAFPDLMRWKERHPWRVGTEMRRFVLRLEEERAKGDLEIEREWTTHAAFLAEVMADEVYTDWLITVLRFDVEMRAQFDTVRTALADIAASIRTNQDATDESILADVEGLRPPIAPPWCFETCVEDLTRIAGAAQAAGHAKAAVEIARQAQAIAEKTHDGEIALWCSMFLLRTSQAAGNPTGAETEVGKLLEVAGGVEHLPTDFETTLAGLLDRFRADAEVAVGIESFRAVRAEQEGNDDEALLHWIAASRQSLQARFRVEPPSLDSLEKALHGPDPARRGALLAARMGRLEEAWDLVRTAVATSAQPDRDAETMQDRLAAQHVDGMVAFVVDRKETLVAWFDAQGARAKIVPIGEQAIRTHGVEVLASMRGTGTGKGQPPTAAFDPTSAREMYRVLVEPLGFPLRGRVGVFQTPELRSVPLGMLIVGEVPGSVEPARPPRPRFLAEDATLLRLELPAVDPDVDEATRSAMRSRILELESKFGNAVDARHAAQIECIEGRGPLGSGRTHPWYWAGFELAAS